MKVGKRKQVHSHQSKYDHIITTAVRCPTIARKNNISLFISHYKENPSYRTKTKSKPKVLRVTCCETAQRPPASTEWTISTLRVCLCILATESLSSFADLNLNAHHLGPYMKTSNTSLQNSCHRWTQNTRNQSGSKACQRTQLLMLIPIWRSLRDNQ